MSRTVLVVDDAAFMRMMIRDILSKEGYCVHEAVNGRDAVEKYDEVRPDLVTMDITMPELDGVSALRRIRANDPAARILMVSATSRREAIAEALEAGALGYIQKPFQPAKMLETLKRCILPAT